MNYIKFFFLLLLFSQCKQENHKPLLETKTIDRKFQKQFICKNDTIIQTLLFDLPKNGQIHFKLISKNILTNNSSEITGIAKSQQNGCDGETDDDEEGNGYFVDEYFYNIKNCGIKIRLDSEENNKAKIVSTCNAKNEISKYESIGVMR